MRILITRMLGLSEANHTNQSTNHSRPIKSHLKKIDEHQKYKYTIYFVYTSVYIPEPRRGKECGRDAIRNYVPSRRGGKAGEINRSHPITVDTQSTNRSRPIRPVDKSPSCEPTCMYLRGVAVKPARRRPSLVSPLQALPTPSPLRTSSYIPPALT